MFQNRDYRFLYASSFLDNVCRWMEILALGLLVLHLTDSPFWVALVGVFRWMPNLLFGVFAGHLADRMDRLRVLVLARSVSTLVTAAILVLLIGDWVERWHVLLGALVLGWTFVLDLPSRQSFIHDLFGRQNLSRAMSMEVINFTIGISIGPLIAGLVIALADFEGAYVFLLSVYILSLVILIQVRAQTAEATRTSQPLWQNIASGLAYALHNRPVLAVLIVTLIINITATGSAQLYPVIARDHLGVGPGLTGVLVSAHGIGMFTGAAIVTFMGAIRFHGRIYIFGCTLLLLGLILFALSPWFPLSFLMLLVVGVGMAGFGTMQSTIVLMSSAPERRGLALGIVNLCIGVGPLGMLQMGAVATLLTTQLAIGISAAVGLVLMIPVIILTPLVWRPVASTTDDAVRPQLEAATDRMPLLLQGGPGEITKKKDAT